MQLGFATAGAPECASEPRNGVTMKSSLLGATAILALVAATFACSTPTVTKQGTNANDLTEPTPRRTDAGTAAPRTEPTACKARESSACFACCEEAAPSLKAVRKAYLECLCQPSVCQNECSKTRCSASPAEATPPAPTPGEPGDPCAVCEYGTANLEDNRPSEGSGKASACIAKAEKFSVEPEMRALDSCIADCPLEAPGADANEDTDGGTAVESGGGGS
jgi:hypothetical protein